MHTDYIKSINKVLIYIDENLGNELSLELISKIACYSPFHLHRLFKAITNENLNAYIIRKRIEKASSLLVHQRMLTVTQLALQCGFNSNSSFTRAFKKHYGQSPAAFRQSYPKHFSKIGKVNSKNGQVDFMSEAYICNINHLKNWITMNAKVEIREVPTLNIAYLTHIGIDALDQTFERLIKWAVPRGLFENNGAKLVRVYHDSFKVTEADKVRMSLGIILKEPIQVDGGIGLTTIKKGKYLSGHFIIEPKDFEPSWSSLFIWMNEKGYKKADGNPFEILHNDFNEHPEKKCIVDLYIPIE